MLPAAAADCPFRAERRLPPESVPRPNHIPGHEKIWKEKKKKENKIISRDFINFC